MDAYAHPADPTDPPTLTMLTTVAVPLITDYETVEDLGYTWAIPETCYWGGSSGAALTPYSGHYAVQTSSGWLILCKVQRILRVNQPAELRYTTVVCGDLPTVKLT